MASYPIQEKVITIDTYCDYIPFASTASNIISIVMKMALGIFELINQDFQREIFEKPLYKHYIDKSAVDCLFLSIPFLNILFALSRDQTEKMDKAIRELQNANNANIRATDELNTQLEELEERLQRDLEKTERTEREPGLLVRNQN